MYYCVILYITKYYDLYIYIDYSTWYSIISKIVMQVMLNMLHVIWYILCNIILCTCHLVYYRLYGLLCYTFKQKHITFILLLYTALHDIIYVYKYKCTQCLNNVLLASNLWTTGSNILSNGELSHRTWGCSTGRSCILRAKLCRAMSCCFPGLLTDAWQKPTAAVEAAPVAERELYEKYVHIKSQGYGMWTN